MKILHISYWYPTETKPLEAIWIKRHVNSINSYAETNVLLHLEYKPASRFKFSKTNYRDELHHIVEVPVSSWFIVEWMTSVTLLYYFIKLKVNRFDIINFHIAYPNCIHLRYLKKWIKRPVIITEHWSGYHFNFNIENPKKRIRIQRIFHDNIPVITVSNALATDIKKFSSANFTSITLPNITDTHVFNYDPENHKDDTPRFLMVSQWKWPKDPFVILEAWKMLVQVVHDAELVIGGYGDQWEDISNLIQELKLDDHVTIWGVMDQNTFANQLRNASAFIHCSGYETFSVVCAEALCCGTPVIASQVGGIPEYLHKGNGMLVAENRPEVFCHTIISFLKHQDEFNREEIAFEATAKFSAKTVGKQYYSVINKIIEG